MGSLVHGSRCFQALFWYRLELRLHWSKSSHVFGSVGFGSCGSSFMNPMDCRNASVLSASRSPCAAFDWIRLNIVFSSYAFGITQNEHTNLKRLHLYNRSIKDKKLIREVIVRVWLYVTVNIRMGGYLINVMLYFFQTIWRGYSQWTISKIQSTMLSLKIYGFCYKALLVAIWS